MKSSAVIWLSGLAGAGKTTFAQALFRDLKKLYPQSILLDGDVFRKIFDEEPDFSLQGRLKVARKISALATFLAESGNLVVCATISCFEEIWQLNRQNIKNYFEIYIKCDLDELIKRDQKGLYSGALRGEITNVIGIDLPFNEPKNAHFVLENSKADHLEAKSALLFEKCLEFLHSQSNDDRKYWQNYYTSHFKPDTQSLFAEFALSYFKEGQSLIELGCGNGRDSVFFAKKNLQVLGVDLASNMIAKLQSDFSKSNLSFLNADFTKLQDFKEGFDVVYSRFTLHSIKAVEQKRLLAWCKRNLKQNGLLCIEVRGQQNSLYKCGVMIEEEQDAFIYDNHYRRFLNFNELKEDLKGYELLFAKEDRGFAPFKDEDDFFIRIIARKK